MKLHLSNIDAAYKDMADGHADALMGLTWGLAGVYASDDAKLKKKVTDHYKAWLNLARCHGSDSYVILPGRDYADSSYYRDNIRNHTTAAVAFIYSYSTPKLRVQGVSGTAGKTGQASRLARIPRRGTPHLPQRRPQQILRGEAGGLRSRGGHGPDQPEKRRYPRPGVPVLEQGGPGCIKRRAAADAAEAAP